MKAQLNVPTLDAIRARALLAQPERLREAYEDYCSTGEPVPFEDFKHGVEVVTQEVSGNGR